MRIYEFAKLLNISNKDLIALLAKEGFEVKSHMAALSQQAIDFLNGRVEAKKKSDVVSGPLSASRQEEISSGSVPLEESIVSEKSHDFIIEPMTVVEAADRLEKPINEVILALLKHGIAFPKNQVLPVSAVEYLAKYYQRAIKVPSREKKQEARNSYRSSDGITRTPIVVVVGHVDHGKTTLLDFIRKTRVVAKEKGGITQHLGAYEVITNHGNAVFLDTPGHEAFSNIRGRGLRVADIAILVVAADDGVMPQTVEAIKRAMDADVGIIVAINKIDRVDASRIESVKKDLARYGLISEDWGGQTICVPISAKTGKGVDNLLEMVVLQAELMDLRANPDRPAIGIVLESKLEKGRGPVATVICQQGTLRIGDFFIAGSVHGKVTSIVNSYGKPVKEIGPSIPVQIAGYSDLPLAGDIFEVVSSDRYAKLKLVKAVSPINYNRAISSTADSINCLVKVDSSSTKEALLDALGKISGKNDKEINVIYAGIGNIIESDVDFAANTNSQIIGLHVKIDSSASLLASKKNVEISLYDVIYKLLEDVEKKAKLVEKIHFVSKKIGEAVVRKIFDIKNVGIVAGCYVKEGRFCKDGRVVVWRGKKKVGEGTIKGLERDRKSVKEVHAGFEFAFTCDGFSEWEIDDRLECFFNVPEK